MGVAERFSGGLKPHDNGGSIPSSHTKIWMRVRSPWGTDHLSCAMGDVTPMTMVTNGGSNPAASAIGL